MSQSVPEKQWAQVFEKSGGPIEYKEIPGVQMVHLRYGVLI